MEEVYYCANYSSKNKLVCDNNRGISLVCHAEKLAATITLHRIRSRTEEVHVGRQHACYVYSLSTAAHHSSTES